MNQEELAELLGCNQQSVADALTKLGLRYHRDSGEQIFSSLGEEDLGRIAEFVADGSQARGLDTPVDNPARQSSVTVRPNNPSGRHPGESDTDANT